MTGKGNPEFEASRIHESAEFYRFVVESLPIAVVTVDPELRITEFNPRAERITGYSAQEAIGEPCSKILRSALCEKECPLETVINRRNPKVQTETFLLDKSGNPVPVALGAAALFDKDGNVVGGLGCFRDITRFKSMERFQSHVLSMFAYDMKYPLVCIQGFAVRLRNKLQKFQDMKVMNYLDVISEESEKLQSMIDELLDYANLQEGKIRLNFKAFRVGEELTRLVEAYRERADRRGVHLSLQVPEAFQEIEADPVRLGRVFAYFLEKAVKNSDKGDAVRVSVEDSETDLTVIFVAEGRGVYPEDLKLFDLSEEGTEYRKDRPTTRAEAFTLEALERIVTGHGGGLFMCVEEGKGNQVRIKLPKIPP